MSQISSHGGTAWREGWCLLAAWLVSAAWLSAAPAPERAAASAADDHAAVLQRYCVTCHNERFRMKMKRPKTDELAVAAAAGP